MAGPINDIFERRGRDAGLPRQGVDIEAMRRAELLDAQGDQFRRIHQLTPVRISIGSSLSGSATTDRLYIDFSKKIRFHVWYKAVSRFEFGMQLKDCI